MTDDPCKKEREILSNIAKEWVWTCGQKMSYLSVEPISSDVELRMLSDKEVEEYKALCEKEQELFKSYVEATNRFNECVRKAKSQSRPNA